MWGSDPEVWGRVGLKRASGQRVGTVMKGSTEEAKRFLRRGWELGFEFGQI